MGSHSSCTRPGRCWHCSSMARQIHTDHTNRVDASRCVSEVMPEEQCVLCPGRGSEKHWLAQQLQPDQLCQQEHDPVSSAVTQRWSTALSEDWLTRRCILVMTEGLASTQYHRALGLHDVGKGDRSAQHATVLSWFLKKISFHQAVTADWVQKTSFCEISQP